MYYTHINLCIWITIYIHIHFYPYIHIILRTFACVYLFWFNKFTLFYKRFAFKITLCVCGVCVNVFKWMTNSNIIVLVFNTHAHILKQIGFSFTHPIHALMNVNTLAHEAYFISIQFSWIQFSSVTFSFNF